MVRIGRYKINLQYIKLRLPKKAKVIFNQNAGWECFRWSWLKPYGKVPIYANRDFQIMYRDRFLCSKEQKKELRLPKGVEQNSLF